MTGELVSKMLIRGKRDRGIREAVVGARDAQPARGRELATVIEAPIEADEGLCCGSGFSRGNTERPAVEGKAAGEAAQAPNRRVVTTSADASNARSTSASNTTRNGARGKYPRAIACAVANPYRSYTATNRQPRPRSS